MPDLSSASTPKEANSFASLLASLTGGPPKRNDTWDDSTLADDVTTISYEQALRAHRRVPLTETLTVNEVSDSVESSAAQIFPPPSRRNRKNASITIRLTEEEEAQLRERAAAAQLTVSAYLRSCIFEAESLRAQVREALTQMRAGPASDSHVSQKPRTKPADSWRSRFLPRWSRPRVSP
jgi:predicted DNA binding CopG/RHH family protein